MEFRLDDRDACRVSKLATDNKCFNYQGLALKAEDIFSSSPAPERSQADSRAFVEYSSGKINQYCSSTGRRVSFSYLLPRADLRNAMIDHQYLNRPFVEYWVDRALQVGRQKVYSIAYIIYIPNHCCIAPSVQQPRQPALQRLHKCNTNAHCGMKQENGG